MMKFVILHSSFDVRYSLCIRTLQEGTALFFLIRLFPFSQLSQLSLEHLAPQRADPVYKQDPVQMIRLMKDHTSPKSFTLQFMGISIYVQKTDPDLSRPRNIPVDTRDAQTSFLMNFFPLFAEDLWVDHNHHVLPVLT